MCNDAREHAVGHNRCQDGVSADEKNGKGDGAVAQGAVVSARAGNTIARITNAHTRSGHRVASATARR